MIPEIGHYALVLALFLALVQSVLPLVGAARGDAAWMDVAKPAAVGQFAMILASFLALTYAHVVSDFSVLNVVQNSHSMKPMLYKVAGVWGNHEGSMVLWVLILALFGCAVALFGRNLPPTLKARVLSVQAMIGVGFLLFIIATSNPFTRVDPAPLDGTDLNPLLQDPGLAFHPPFLYFGYVGFSMAFSFAVAALIEGRIDPAWARWVRPWTLAAWAGLTLGIALGSWWAYYELGWGGWWFWDPVENASFMPWLAGTALLHSAIVVEKRDALKSWTVLLAILTFVLSLIGTFLVRSGVLTSVHAFAVDPARGVFILLLLTVATVGALLLYAIRAPSMKMGGLFAPISREGALVLNNLLLSTATATVFLGTLYPLFLDAIDAGKVSVGPPFFNSTFIPLMVPLVAAMSVGPLLAWKRADLAGALSRLKFAAVLTVICVLGALYAYQGGPVMALLGVAMAAWAFFGAIFEFADRIRLFRAPLGDSLRRAGGTAALRLGHDHRPCRHGHRDRRHDRFGRLDDRAHPVDAAGRYGPDRRIRCPVRRGPRTSRRQLSGQDGDLHRQPGRSVGGDAPPGGTLVPGHPHVHDGGRDPDQLRVRPLRRAGSGTAGHRRLRHPPVPPSAGPLDLDRLRGHGGGRLRIAERPALPDRRAGEEAEPAADSASRRISRSIECP